MVASETTEIPRVRDYLGQSSSYGRNKLTKCFIVKNGPDSLFQSRGWGVKRNKRHLSLEQHHSTDPRERQEKEVSEGEDMVPIFPRANKRSVQLPMPHCKKGLSPKSEFWMVKSCTGWRGPLF